MDRVSPSGLFRDERHAARWGQQHAAGDPPARAKPEGSADNDRSCRILDETLSAATS